MTQQRIFDTGDSPTDQNLNRLDHLALHPFGDTADQMHDWLSAVIQSIALLPSAAASHFNVAYYQIADQHYRASTTERAELLKRLAARLDRQVASAFADPALSPRSSGSPTDLSDRRQTRGERILAACKELEKAGAGTTEFEHIMRKIEQEGNSEIRSDISALRRLSKKGGADTQDRYWIARHIARIRAVAGQIHHLG
jgi:hypothetical protein